MNYTLFSRCAIAAVLSSSLLGCGENSGTNTTDNTTPTPPEVFPIIAMDGFAAVTPGGKASVDVAPYIRGARGFEKLTAVEPIGDSDECSDVTLNEDGLIFEVKTGAGVFCDYQYTVAGQQAGAPVSASMSVFSTSAEQAILPPLSHSMLIDDSSATLNLQALLGTDWPTGYTLNTQTVKIQAEASNLGVATSSANVITYTPPSNAGWNRILYTLTDASRPGNDVMGTIYVTVSESVNHPPSIDNPKYDYNAKNGAVKIGQLIDIDLSPAVTEPDGQEWQVIDVRSYTATAAAKDPNSVTNKVIRFQAATVGEHIISYIVADHYGGYSAGLIKVTTIEDEKESTWASLNMGKITYSAPLRYSDGVNSGFAVSAVWDDGVGNTLSGYTGISANAYCYNLGFMPTLEQMQLLRSAHYQDDKSGELNKWPAMKPYLIKSGTDYLGYDVTTGKTNAYSPQASYYVTCAINNDIRLIVLTREVVADGEEKVIGRVENPLSQELKIEKAENTRPDALDNVFLQLRAEDSGRKVQEITTSSINAGTYRFKLVNQSDNTDDELTSPVITYIGDITNPALNKDDGSIDSAVADDAAEVSATFTLKDLNDNPLANQEVDVTWQANTLDEVTMTAPINQTLKGSEITIKGVTNSAGKLSVSAMSGNALDNITVTVKYNHVEASWNPIFTSLLPNTTDFVRVGNLMFARPRLSSEAAKLNVPYGGQSETGEKGPEGDWATYKGVDMSSLCNAYNDKNYNGRSNWRVPTNIELQGLQRTVSNAFNTQGWPTSLAYLSNKDAYTNNGYPGYVTAWLDGRAAMPVVGVNGYRYLSCVTKELAGPYIDTVGVNTTNGLYSLVDEVGAGMLYTSSPSVDYLKHIGAAYTSYHSDSGVAGTYGGLNREQALNLCTIYNKNKLWGRSNWRLARVGEINYLKLYYDPKNSNKFMSSEHGWPWDGESRAVRMNNGVPEYFYIVHNPWYPAGPWEDTSPHLGYKATCVSPQ